MRSDVCAVSRLYGLAFVWSDVCVVSRLCGLTFVRSHVSPVWRLCSGICAVSRLCGLAFVRLRGVFVLAQNIVLDIFFHARDHEQTCCCERERSHA